MTKGKPETGSA